MSTVTFNFAARTSPSLAELLRRSGHRDMPSLLEAALAAYAYATGREGDLELGRRFAAVNMQTNDYKTLRAGIDAIAIPRRRTALDLPLDLEIAIKSDFGGGEIEQTLENALGFYDRLLDARDQGYNSAGFVDKKGPGKRGEGLHLLMTLPKTPNMG